MRQFKFFFVLLLTLLVATCTESDDQTVNSTTSLATPPGLENRSSSSLSNSGSNDVDAKNDAPTQPDPMHAALIGTWRHVSTAKTPDGPREPLEIAAIEWTFDSDGKGSYRQIVRGIPGGSGDSSFNWKLTGNDIELAPADSSRRTTFTIMGKSATEMTWKNNTLGDFYFVEKQ